MTFPGLPVQASAYAPDIDFVLGLEHWSILTLFVFSLVSGLFTLLGLLACCVGIFVTRTISDIALTESFLLATGGMAAPSTAESPPPAMEPAPEVPPVVPTAMADAPPAAPADATPPAEEGPSDDPPTG